MHPREAFAFGTSRRANVCDSMSVLWWTECMNTHGVAQTMRGLRAERAIKIVQVIVSEERAPSASLCALSLSKARARLA